MSTGPIHSTRDGNSSDVKLPVKGTRFYAFAFICIAATASIAFVWSAKVQKVYALSQQMTDQASAGKFQTAVETCREIEQASPRYAKPQWLQSQQQLLVRWARRALASGDLSVAIDRAGQAVEINANTTEADKATEVLAGALLARLKLQASQLTPDQCIGRAQQIASQYPQTQAGAQANNLVGQYRYNQTVAQEKLIVLEDDLGQLLSSGLIVEAVSVLDAYLSGADPAQLEQLFDESWAGSNLEKLINRADGIWLGRIDGGSGDQWRAWPITADHFLPDWLACPGRKSVFAASQPATPGLPVRLELVAGQIPQPGQVLLPVMLGPTEINLRVHNSKGQPLEDIDIYVGSDIFPGISPQAWFGATDPDGRFRFDWPGPGPAMVLLAWQSVPLITATVIPGCDQLTVPDKWQLDASIVSLEKYVSAKSSQFSDAVRQSKTRQDHFHQIHILLTAGKVDQASDLLDSLAGDDPVARKLRLAIKIASERASAQTYLSAADQAAQSGQLPRAFALLHEALSVADENQRDQVARRLITIESQLDQLKQNTASARKLLFEQLDEMSIDEINSQSDQVTQAVGDLVQANHRQWLVQAGKSLLGTISSFDQAIDTRLKEMEASFSDKGDRLSQLLEKRELLNENLARIRTALEATTS